MALDVAEILAKVQRIQIVASRQVDDLLAGEYASVFKGRGMEFDEVREYQPGDDVRTIDWNVTARHDRPYVKRFCEERELTVLFAVDISASNAFGTVERSKLELATELAALLMFSALRNNDKVGLLLFDSEVRAYFPPRKGRGAVLRLLRELVAIEPAEAAQASRRGRTRGERGAAPGTDIAAALSFVRRVQKRRSVLFLFSDFLGEDYEQALRIANKHHDVVAVTVGDPRERELPPVGFVTIQDPETGEILELDTSHARVRELFASEASRRTRSLSDRLRRCDVDALPIETARPYTADLHRFFRMRERRRR